MAEKEKSRFWASFVAGMAVMLILLSGLFLLTRLTASRGTAVEQRLPFGAEEQVYAEHIYFLNIHLSRAANFLNQEVTYVDGVLANDGARNLREVEATVEFHDPFNQVILREARRLVGSRAQPLGGGQRREFQISLEHVPAEWNHQYPSIRVTGLQFE